MESGRGAAGPEQPARRGPAQHQLRGRQHLRQGHRRPTRSPAQPVELLWVKGSGGDLGTLTEAGLAVLRLDRLRALTDVYPGVEREDEMVAAFDYCLHGKGGAAPSIDTAMHGLVDAAHVDHLHPDAGIAFATAADGEALTKECFGDRVPWVPWRRPGFQLGLDIAAIKRQQPAGDRRDPRRARHHRVGCDQRRVRGATRWRSSAPRSATSTSTAAPSRSGRSSTNRCPTPSAGAGRRARAGDPRPRLAPTSPQVGHFTDTRRGARLPRPRTASRELAALGTSCPDHFLRTKVRAAGARPAADRAARRRGRAAARAARRLPRRLPRLLRAARRRRTARRCAAPTRRSCWCRASACSASAPTSRPRASPASSTSTPST